MNAPLDATVQSAINTLRGWRVRRETNGKPVSPADVAARIKILWGDEDLDVEAIVAGAMK